ncbi:hypothetical protein [Enterobacter phage 02_vB_Eclo_IJM]|nr:hypothetical protein [Enterobacter phage 02_vB_Eclo_IJM]
MDLPTVNLLGCYDVYRPETCLTREYQPTPAFTLFVYDVSDGLKNLAGGLRVTTNSDN